MCKWLTCFKECDLNWFWFRVDAPYKPITDHGKGKRMGGGKGSIDEYGTPVRLNSVAVMTFWHHFKGESWQGSSWGGRLGWVDRGASPPLFLPSLLKHSTKHSQKRCNLGCQQSPPSSPFMPLLFILTSWTKSERRRWEPVTTLWEILDTFHILTCFVFQARLEQENTNPITFEWLVRKFVLSL